MIFPQEHTIISFLKSHFSALLIIFMPVSFIFYTSAPTVIILFFVVCGYYHVFQKPYLLKTNPTIFIIGLLIALYLLISAFFRGIIIDDWNGLDDAFPIYLSIIIPAFCGLVIVKNPIQSLITGCRLATIVVTIISIYLLLEYPSQRNGFGTNPLIAGYITMVFACVSRFKRQVSEKDWVGITFFYLGVISAIATGSRIIILFYILAVIIDCIFVLKDILREKQKVAKKLIFIFSACVSAVVISLQYSEILRLDYTINALITMDFLSDYSLKLRVLMWEFGWSQFIDNILFGIGAVNIHEELALYLQENYNINFSSRHLHNLFIHEIVSIGAIGAAMIVTFHYLVFRRAMSHLKEHHDKLSLIFLFLAILVYGLTGSHLTDERMLILTTFVFAILITANK